MPVEVCFTENETAGILWVLRAAADLADQADLLSSLALFEQTYDVVRGRYDDRGRE